MSNIPETPKAEELLDIPQAEAEIAKANIELSRLCNEIWNTGKGWRWSIPADRERDSDLIINDALMAGQKALQELKSVHASKAAIEPAPSTAALIEAEQVLEIVYFTKEFLLTDVELQIKVSRAIDVARAALAQCEAEKEAGR